jgi:osomolarity two-component system sensor histidine kinase TcsA
LKANKPAKEMEICMREGRVEDEGWRYRKDGSCFWANVVITAIFDKGVHVGFGKVTRDLTERKNGESRLIAAYEESSQLKSKFLANMSHEIRTPMHGMLSANTLLCDTKLTNEQQELSDIIHESGRVLLQVINDILDYSKLAAGSFSLNSGVVDVAYTIKSVIRSCQTLLKPGVRFELELSPDLPISVAGDALRYRQVLQNLIGNAVKFTDHGFIHIHTVVTKQSTSQYLISTSIKDTGIGIPDLARDALFTPFRQFNDANLNTHQGTGLGLSISKSLVELMGGQIGFDPNPDCQGSIFWFAVPFEQIRSTDEVAVLLVQNLKMAHANACDFQTQLFGPKNLLLVEDNIINQRVMVKMLRSLGFNHIETALNGEQALHLVKTNNRDYDLILMDIDMPVMDGITATKQLRRDSLQAPILALTANAFESDRRLYLEAGMDECIPKPVDKGLLTRMLVRWLKQKHSFAFGEDAG